MTVSIKRKLRNENRINNNFENILSQLSLEEIIALKLELSTPIVRGKMYGSNIYYTLPVACRDALIRWALTMAPGKKSAADFLGIDYANMKKLDFTHKYFKLLEEERNGNKRS